MRSPREKHRRGTLVLSVLACLTLAVMLLAAWLKIVALEREQLRAQQNRMQAEYLADSALARAASRLAADPAYAGETLSANLESPAGGAPAKVTIRVEPRSGDTASRFVTASAQVAARGRDLATRSKQRRIPVSSQEPTP